VDIDGTWLLIVVGLTVLCLLLTGPGMWSENWGWGWFSRGKEKRDRPASPPTDRPPGRDGA
jgi:hypothetical protein